MTEGLRCQHCDEITPDVKRRRQNTAYEKEEMNWVVLCDECHEENEAYWQERWDDYYGGLL